MRYQVDSDAVLAATSAARSTISRVQTDIHSLTSQLHGLQGSWSGQASTAFQQVLAEWKCTHAHVEAQLVALTDTLAQVAHHYSDLEAQNARLFMR